MFDSGRVQMPLGSCYSGPMGKMLERTNSYALGANEIWRDRGTNVKTAPYRWTANLEQVGVPVLLHTQYNGKKNLGPMVEFIGAGKYSLDQWKGFLAEIFNWRDVNLARFTRLDPCHDLIDRVPVGYFREHCRVKHKKKHRTFGHYENFHEVSKAIAETVYAGDKNDQYRIYAKNEERKAAYAKMLRAMTPTERQLCCSFEEFWPHGDAMVVRVEREVHAKKDRPVLGMTYLMELTPDKVMSLRPFEAMVLPSLDIPDLEGLEGEHYFALKELLRYKSTHGLQNTINEMKRKFRKKTYQRRSKMYLPYLQANSTIPGVTLEEITRGFQDSTIAQLWPIDAVPAFHNYVLAS